MRTVHVGHTHTHTHIHILTRNPPFAFAYPLSVTELTTTATVCRLNPPELAAGRLRSRALLKVTITTSRRHRATARACKTAPKVLSKGFAWLSAGVYIIYRAYYLYILLLLLLLSSLFYVYLCVCVCVHVCYRIPTPFPSHHHSD
jgi:hypothetical protein